MIWSVHSERKLLIALSGGNRNQNEMAGALQVVALASHHPKLAFYLLWFVPGEWDSGSKL